MDYEKTKDGKEVRKIKEWTKRNDHRHHIMDAITVAFTRPSHVQYFNYLNARSDKNHKEHYKIKGIEDKETIHGAHGRRIVKPPMPLDELRAETKKHLEGTLVSFKAKNKVSTRNKNKTKKKGKKQVQDTLTPRGQLHKETVYGRKKRYVTKEEKIGSQFDAEKIKKVANKKYRKALLARLAEFDNNPKKAFTGKNALSKNPIWVDEAHTQQIPERVKLVELQAFYTIRKEVRPDLKIEKVVDKGLQTILQKRLEEFKGDKKKAFSNLDENPIWLNKEKGIAIKNVTITGVSNAEPLHYKKDHFGNVLMDNLGTPIPADYVSTGNNHHVAIYRDADGKLQEQVVSFYEAVMRKKMGEHVIDRSFNSHLGWQFLFTMKQNEMFVFPNEKTGFDPNGLDLKDPLNYSKISPNLFRVQAVSSVNYGNNTVRDFRFRHHLDTTTNKDLALKDFCFKVVKSLSDLNRLMKVRINHLGQIVKVGEY